MQRTVDRVLKEVEQQKQAILDTIECSPIFTSCRLKNEVSDLIQSAVRQGEGEGGGSGRNSVVLDDSDLQEISLSYVNDKGPDDMVLPCGLRILRLN
jgi:hypothetical protein